LAVIFDLDLVMTSLLPSRRSARRSHHLHLLFYYLNAYKIDPLNTNYKSLERRRVKNRATNMRCIVTDLNHNVYANQWIYSKSVKNAKFQRHVCNVEGILWS